MSDEPSKVFDVARPSHVNPDNTSRPIIPGHHPSMPDPMMRPKPPAPEPAPTPSVLTPPASTPGIVLQPGRPITPPTHEQEHNSITEHHQAKVIEVSDKARIEIAASEPKLPEVSQPETPQPIVPSAMPHEPAPGIVSASPAVVDTPASNFVSSTTSPGGNVIAPAAVPPPTPLPAVDTPISAPTPTAEPVVHHQTLPMGHPPVTGAGRLKHVVLWLSVILFFAAFAGYLAIDAGFVSSPIKLPFHIFDRQK